MDVQQFHAVTLGMLVHMREPATLQRAHSTFVAYSQSFLAAPTGSAPAPLTLTPDLRFATYSAAVMGK